MSIFYLNDEGIEEGGFIMQKLCRISRLLIVLAVFMVLSTVNVFAATTTVTRAEVEADSSLPGDCYYFLSSDSFVFKNSSGKCGEERSLSTLVDTIKNSYYKSLVKQWASKFENTVLFDGIEYTGTSIANFNPMLDQKVDGYCSGENGSEGYFSIKADSTYKFYLPYGSYIDTKMVGGVSTNQFLPKISHPSNSTYQVEGKLLKNAEAGVTAIIKGVKEGLIAGNIECGYNIGTVYSDNQVSLDTVMQAYDGKDASASPSDNSKASPDTSNSSSSNDFYKFKDSYSLKATMDYFICPLFGKIRVEDLPKDDAAWNAKISDIDALVEGDAIKINEGYRQFIGKTSADFSSIKPLGNLSFTNGVQAYTISTGVKTQEPGKYVNYNMRIAVPYYFEQTAGGYRMRADGLKTLDGYTISLYNDAIFKTEASTGVVSKLCTCADLDLDRKYLAFYNQEVNGVKIGVVIVLRYEEGVVDVNDGGKMYFTGRKVAFGGNYSSALKLTEQNRDTMYFTTKTSGKQAILPQFFAFNIPTADGTIQKLYSDKGSHKEVKDAVPSFVFCIDFRQVDDVATAAGATPTPTPTGTASPSPSATPAPTVTPGTSEGKTKWGFVIIRNNYYVKDGQLLSWLSSHEAIAMTNIHADTLRKKIMGEFKPDDLTYTDWKAMQEIKGEIEAKQDNVLIQIMRNLSLVIGVLLEIFALLFIFAYWFDIFNTFLDIKILYILSRGNMYPVWHKEEMQYLSEYQGKVRFVTFPYFLKVAILSIFLGVLFMNFTPLLVFFTWIYNSLTTMFGGM